MELGGRPRATRNQRDFRGALETDGHECFASERSRSLASGKAAGPWRQGSQVEEWAPASRGPTQLLGAWVRLGGKRHLVWER